jgi:glycosyltransferase involved in cell wall biosynthesis
MKLAILSFYSGFVSRGVETFVQELSANLAQKIDLTVYQAGPVSDSNTYPAQTIKLDLDLPQKDATGTLSRYFFLDYYSRKICQFTHKTLRLLESDPPDILLPLNNGWMSFLSKKFAWQHQTKLVLAGFAGIGWEDKLNLWLNPEVFICCTRYHVDWAGKINPKARLKLIHIGVNTKRFRPEGKKYPLKLKPPIVLCVAGPQAYKRLDLAIKAVAGLKDVSFLVIGQQSARINQLGQKLLGSRYQNLQVEYQDLDSVYRSVNLFTLPSAAHEAYGISILEALASNLPVVVNNDQIRKELVGSVGLTVDPTNLKAYRQAIKTGLAQNFANRPRQQALKFSWTKISQEYLQFFQSL